MTISQTIEFDKEMANLAMGVYKKNKGTIPKDWINITESNNDKTGFHCEAFYKDRTIVIAMRGTNDKSDLANDIDMAKKKLPNQYADAQKFYKQIKKEFPNYKIVFVGHSLGGSLAQLLANETGCEAVTFNAYGVKNILKDNIKNDGENIRNYGNIDDMIFNINLRNQLGHTYIIDNRNITNINGYITKSPYGDYLGGTKLLQHHFIEKMGNLEDAVEYKPTYLEGKVSMNVDFKDFDNNRVFTNEEIKDMSLDEFKRLENFINQQIATGNVMSENQAKQELKAGNLIYVNSYVRTDGTEVKGYYRRKPSGI